VIGKAKKSKRAGRVLILTAALEMCTPHKNSPASSFHRLIENFASMAAG